MRTHRKYEHRYLQMMLMLDEIANDLHVVAFRPDYHAKDRDKNTVLFYTPEDHAYNRNLDTNDPWVRNEDYRPFFFSFENTDVNGFLNYDFANFGKLDLRVNGADVLREAIFKALQAKKAGDAA